MRSDEAKIARTIGKSLDTADFNPGVIVYSFIINQPVAIRLRLWKIFLAMVSAYAEKFRSGNVLNDEEFHAAVQAARFEDTLRQFGDLDDV